MLPQLAATGEDTQAADDAAWVVDATIDDVEAGTNVRLVGETGDGEWETVSEAETDKDGHVALTSTADGELHVVVGEGDEALGAEVSTADAPGASFTDDFSDDSVDTRNGPWRTRDQGHIGVRTCSRADPSAAEVDDGVLRLSVIDDPDRDLCQPNGGR